ncbi:MAG: hypothetical protein QXI39_06695 [Candidatus Bathyarchaeia archaeon]
MVDASPIIANPRDKGKGIRRKTLAAKIEALKSIAKSLPGINLLEVKAAKEKEVGRELSKEEELELFENELGKLREGKRDPQRIARRGSKSIWQKDGSS